MLVSLVQPSNGSHPKFVTPALIVTLARLVQPPKAPIPMFVTLPGIMRLVRLVQPLNTTLSKLRSPVLNVTLVRLVKFSNDAPYAALPLMLVTLLPNITLLRLLQYVNTPPPDGKGAAAVGKCYTGEICAAIECIRIEVGEAPWNSYASQAGAALERT